MQDFIIDAFGFKWGKELYDKAIVNVRRAYVVVYNMRSNLTLEEGNKGYFQQFVNETNNKWITSAILDWPLTSHHSLMRFDMLVWELVNLYTEVKNKYDLKMEWIPPLYYRYIYKCVGYFNRKVDNVSKDTQKIVLAKEELKKLKRSGYVYMDSLKGIWEEPEMEKVSVYLKKKQNKVWNYRMTVDERLSMLSRRVCYLNNLQKKYIVNIDKYTIKFTNHAKKVFGNEY